MKQMPGFLIAFILLASLLIATNSLADTGTYRIIDYSVALNPKLNGEILMDYSQTWLVTGGIYSLGYRWPTECELSNNELGGSSKKGQQRQ